MATIGKFTGGVNTPATITETAVSVTVTLHGSAATGAKLCEGGGSVDLSTPISIALPAGAVKSIKLGSIRDLLTGTIAVAGGVAGVFAYILK